jgi:hypothetical protein
MMEAVILFCRDRARVIARPSTYGELITLVYHMFGLEPGTLSHIVFNYEMPGGGYVSAELDQSAYYVVGNGACLGCVLTAPPWASPDPAPTPAPAPEG